MIKRILATSAISVVVIAGGLAQSTMAQSNKGNDKANETPKFIAAQSSDQWVFSKFKGSDVIGPNNETIGSVSDMLFDKDGKILGIVVGVGGFLGIGQKNVAIDMGAFQPVPVPASSSTQAPVTSNSNDPTNVRLKVAWTKDELQKAPDFQYYKPPADTTSSKPSTTGMAPQQTPAQPAPQPK